MDKVSEHQYYLMRRHGFETVEQCCLFESLVEKTKGLGYSLTDATKLAKYMIETGADLSEARHDMFGSLTDSGKVVACGYTGKQCRNVLTWLKKRGLDVTIENLVAYKEETVSIKELLRSEYNIVGDREVHVNYDRILRYGSLHRGEFKNNLELVASYMNHVGFKDSYGIRRIQYEDSSIDYDTAYKILKFAEKNKIDKPDEAIKAYNTSNETMVKEDTLYSKIIKLGYDRDDARRIAEAARRRGNTTDLVEALSNYRPIRSNY